MILFSIVIVTHDREELLMKCLNTLNPGIENWQLVLLANGKKLSESIVDKVNTLTSNVKMLNSSTKLTPGKARNLALKEVEGEWIYFLDDDAFLLPGYWEKVFPLLKEERVDVLGGPDAPVEGAKDLSLAVSLALSSPFCSGKTFARHTPSGHGLQVAQETKLSSCNLWVRKSSLVNVEFPEDFTRGEETVFLERLTSLGKGLYYHPKLIVAHHRRSKLSEFWHPTYYSGYYRSRQLRKSSNKDNKVFWLPVIFVVLHFLIFIDPPVFWYLVRMYSSVILFVSLGLAMKSKKLRLFPLIAFFHYYIVFTYGVGMIAEKLEMKLGMRA